MSNVAKRAQEKAIEDKIEEMLLYYIANCPSPDPPVLCVNDTKFRGKILRWFEPLLPPPIDNPILVEEALGDNWTLRFEKNEPKIKIYVP